MGLKQVNIVYDAHSGKELYYDGPDGKGWISKEKSNEMPNIYLSICRNPQPTDNVIILEPIVVNQEQYKIEYLKQFNKIFTFSKAFEASEIKDKCITINCGSDLISRDADVLRKNWLPWENRKNGVLIIAANKDSNHNASIYKLRIKLADLFYENGFEVSWYGGNISRPYYKGNIKYDTFHENKINEICKYKFHLCTENTYDPIYSYNYLTEKLPHAIYGGSIPLYIGCYNIEDLAPKNTFFDLRKFVTKTDISKESLIKTMNNFSKEEFNEYNSAQYNFIKDPFGISYHTDMKRFYQKMLSILWT